MNITRSILAGALLLSSSHLMAATIINPVEDVMTSSFFFAPNSVRGYAGEGRNTFRVSTNDPFGTTGAETIYLTFNAADFSGLTTSAATLTMQSVDGGFNNNAGAGNPFTVSAHAVNADPLSNITDDTNLTGTTNWLDFYNNNILAADAAASTTINAFGAVTFDISSIVNDWITGANTVFAIALTGMNETSGNQFLHGFANNSELAGSTSLSVAAVPIPAAVWLFGSAMMGLFATNRKRKAV